ncbi:vWA domain-containing protein [Antrihabitans stalactiti]|nr:VWA domain-containing protein [Antrihabitans stalactiti]
MSRLGSFLFALAVVALLAACSSDAGDSAVSSESASSAPAAIIAVPTVLILDASGSMTIEDAPGSRIDAARIAAVGLIDSFPGDAMVGLVTYGIGTGSSDDEKVAGCQDVKSLVGLGRLDRDRVRGEIDALRPSGYTPISLAMRRAASMLPTDGGNQAIVLVSDGEDTCGVPPCEVARELRLQHPGLSISTVGFKTDGTASEQLNCVATTTDGLFVQAANSRQLAARLLATQDTKKARESLSTKGLAGIDLGLTVGEVKRGHSDFPDVGLSGRVVVVWRDCDFTFQDGVLDSIAPHGGGRTIDGIAPGTPIAKAIELYGDPLETVDNKDGTYNLTLTADEARRAGYKFLVKDYTESKGSIAGTIATIALCRCLPPAPSRAPDPCAGVATGCAQVAEVDVDGDGTYDRVAVIATANSGKGNPTASVTVKVATAREVEEILIKVEGPLRSSSDCPGKRDQHSEPCAYDGAFLISRPRGADLVVTKCVCAGGVPTHTVITWTGNHLSILASPGDRNWPTVNYEGSYEWLSCERPGEVTESRLSPTSYAGMPNPAGGIRKSERFTYADGRWTSVGAESVPDLSADIPDFWKTLVAFKCTDQARR